MPEDLKLSQIGSAPLPLPFGGLHSPGVRKHCQIMFACYFRKSSIVIKRYSLTQGQPCALYNNLTKKIILHAVQQTIHAIYIYIYMPAYTQSIATGMHGLHRPVKRPVQRKVLSWAQTEWYDSQTESDSSKVSHIYRLYNTEIEIMSTLQ